jgi:hypothetical protein
VLLIGRSRAWTASDEAASIVDARTTWLLSSHGQDEARNATTTRRGTTSRSPAALYGSARSRPAHAGTVARRIARQIEPDGRQPRELERTRSWDYSEFNLRAFFDLAALGERVGVDVWGYKTADGRSIRQALDFLVPYAAGERKWNAAQITPFRPAVIHRLLRRGAVAWKEPKCRALAMQVVVAAPGWI